MNTALRLGLRFSLSHAANRSLHLLLTLLALWFPPLVRADFGVNLQPPASDLAQDIFDLHSTILWICAAIMIVVFVPMFIALVKHRKAAGHQPSKFHDNLKLEIVWTVIPVLILVGMAWPATKLIVAMKDTDRPDLTIKVTGHQWKWEYEYFGEGIRFMSNTTTPLVAFCVSCTVW